MIEKWKKLSSKIIGDFKIFKLKEHTSISPRNAKEFPFLVLDTNDWINIIPLTAEGNVVFVKQFRHGNEEITLEIPGGLVDNDDSSAMEAAKRELLEETGYVSEEVYELGICSPNPAIFNNNLHVFLALNSKLISTQKQDGAEDIEVVEIPLEEISKYIRSGQINHALVIAAFYLLNNSEHLSP